MRRIQVAAAIAMRGDELLLVRQSFSGSDFWSLPGGVLEEGEGVLDGLRRELEEETGFLPQGAVKLAHVTELRAPGVLSLAHVFSVHSWERSVNAPERDPGGEVLSWEFVPLEQACDRLRALPFPAMREPILAYLGGSTERFYSYVVTESGDDPTCATRVTPVRLPASVTAGGVDHVK